MSEHAEVVIDFYGTTPTDLLQLAELHSEHISLIHAKGFGAVEFTVQALVVLAPVIAAQISGIVKAHLQARQAVIIKADGVEISGLDAEDAIAVLRQLADAGRREQEP